MFNKLILEIRNYAWNFFVNTFAASYLVPRHIRFIIYKLANIKVYRPYIHDNIYFGSNNISIGKEGTYINQGCFFDNANGAMIEIGNNCAISYQVMFCTTNHKIGSTNRRSGSAYGENIIINDGCWIGARATILSGVTIEKGCIIAAGAVVTKNCTSNGLYAGVPAIRIKDLTN